MKHAENFVNMRVGAYKNGEVGRVRINEVRGLVESPLNEELNLCRRNKRKFVKYTH